jgi:hypothetical protein
VFQREIDGLQLHFRLAGINNQNFLMRDEETGTYWQQINGRAISGPLAGRQLALVSADDLSYGLWRDEEPNGTVLQDAKGYERNYAPKDWDLEMAQVPTVLGYGQAGLKPRDLMIGVHKDGLAKAYPYTRVLKQKLIEDNIGPTPVIVVAGPDNVSVRVFMRRVASLSATVEFYSLPDSPLLMDSETGSHWDFRGCAVEGRSKGTCLERVQAIRDYWFDWRHYNPETTVYGVRQRIR